MSGLVHARGKCTACQLTNVRGVANASLATLGVVALHTALWWQSGATPTFVGVGHGHDGGTDADTCLLAVTLGLVVEDSVVVEAGRVIEASSRGDGSSDDCRYRMDRESRDGETECCHGAHCWEHGACARVEEQGWVGELQKM
jgi:hypothetical protein